MAVVQAQFLKEVDKELDCNRLKPAYVPACNFPAGGELKRGPAVSDDNADAPRCGGINEKMKVLKGAVRVQGVGNTAIVKLVKPP